MPFYRCGSKGPEVERIQARLKELGHYHGPVDGDFGGGTESAVKTFQKAKGLTPDGIVGPQTWKLLFPKQEILSPEILQKPLAYRCLALTGTFETNAPIPECFAGLSGDFDNQGISFGALQWNLGQGSLQPLLEEMDRAHPEVLKESFDEHYSERAVALMFDIIVQNGGISKLVKAQIEQDFTRLERSENWEEQEVARLRIIAHRRAEAAKPRWIEDVRVRKLTIANGEGTVHGRYYQLQEQYGIRLDAVAVS